MKMLVISSTPAYDRAKELRESDETKAGVKGLVDAGVVKVPFIFVHPPDTLHDLPSQAQLGSIQSGCHQTHLNILVIDLQEAIKSDGKDVVDKIWEASERWGFFQVVNHGIIESVLQETLEGVRRFYEQDTEIKKQLYTRDFVGKKVV